MPFEYASAPLKRITYPQLDDEIIVGGTFVRFLVRDGLLGAEGCGRSRPSAHRRARVRDAVPLEMDEQDDEAEAAAAEVAALLLDAQRIVLAAHPQLPSRRRYPAAGFRTILAALGGQAEVAASASALLVLVLQPGGGGDGGGDGRGWARRRTWSDGRRFGGRG